MVIRAGALLGAIAAVAWCGAAASATPLATPTKLGRPTPAVSWVARLHATSVVRTGPRATARMKLRLQAWAPLGGGSTVLQVTNTHVDPDGNRWVKVRLPIRPNGSQGWIRAEPLTLRAVRLHIVVDLSQRRVFLRRDGRVIWRAPVAIGAPGTPTPVGRFAVAERIMTRTPNGFLGPVVFPLTGYSRTLNEYAGGNGRIAIHGTSLPELIGTRASHGCIRLKNADVRRLSRLVRPGTPVTIRR
ncbi:MAG: L,D-transpeptidase [Thermoleophilia bacterium]